MIRYTPLVFAATIASVWVAQKYLPQIGSEIVSRILAETSELICRLHQESHQQSLMIANLSDRVKTTQESLDRVYDSIFQTEQLIRHQTLLIQNLSDSVEQLRDDGESRMEQVAADLMEKMKQQNDQILQLLAANRVSSPFSGAATQPTPSSSTHPSPAPLRRNLSSSSSHSRSTSISSSISRHSSQMDPEDKLFRGGEPKGFRKFFQ